MKKLLTVLFISFALATGAAYADEKPSPLTADQAMHMLQEGKPVYSCGMKPHWFSDAPGQCPCCTMQLEKVKDIKNGNAVFDTGSQSMPMNMMEKQ